jgi:hypothetical protein
VLFTGTPEELSDCPQSKTAPFLKKELDRLNTFMPESVLS